jgi:acyl-CoA thioesterase
MNGKDVAEHFNTRDPFARLLGIRVVEVGEGSSKARMELTEELTNGLRMAHGGAIFSLADLAFAAAANSSGRTSVAVSVCITYTRPVYSGTMTAEAREVSRGRKLGTYVVTVTNQDGEVCAQFQGTAYNKEEPRQTGPSGPES